MKEKLLKFTPKYYELSGSLNRATYLGLNISDICNYNCLKCCQEAPKGLENRLSTERGTELSIDEFIDIISTAQDELGIQALFIAGRGETLLPGKGKSEQDFLENYKKLVNFAHKKGIHIIQFTNGYYLTKEMVDFLANKDVSLVMSIDSLDEKDYLYLCGSSDDSFQRVMDNLQYARQKFQVEEEDNKKIYRLAINMAVSHPNFEEVEKLKDFCGEDIMFICNYPIIKGDFEKNMEEMHGSENNYESFKKKVFDTSDNKGFSGTRSDGKCGYIFNGLSIDTNGNVLLCPYDISTGKLFGNVKDYNNLEEALNNVKEAMDKHNKKYSGCEMCFLRDKDYGNFPNAVH